MTPKKEMTVRELAALGGKGRAAKLTKEQLSKIGRKGAARRWAAKKGEKA